MCDEMSDREVRSRKKRKGALEKGAADEIPVEKHKHHKHSDSELEDDVSVSEPSATARVTFLVVFVALAVMVGAVFLALQTSSSLNTFHNEGEPQANEPFIVPKEELELESQHYATDVEESSEPEPDIQSNEQSINLGAFNIDSTEPLQPSEEHVLLETSQTTTPSQHFEATAATDPLDVPSEQTSETTLLVLTESEVLSSTEILQPSHTKEVKQDESAQAVSLEATKVSEASSPPASEMATSTVETITANQAPVDEQAATTNEYDAKIQNDLTESEELTEKEMDDVFWDM